MRFINWSGRWSRRAAGGATGMVVLRASQSVGATGLPQGPARQLSYVRLERTGALGEPQIVQHAQGPAARLPAWVASGAFRQAGLVLMLDASQRQIMVLDEPEVSAAERLDALRWPLASALELPPESVHFDAAPLPAIHEGKARKLLVAACQVGTLEPLLAMLREAGLQADAVDVVDMAQRNALLLQLRLEPAAPSAAHLVLGVCGREMLVSLVAGGELCVPRNMPLPEDYAPDRVDEALSDRIVLHVQRTVDLFERQITRFSINRSFVTAGEFSAATLQALSQVVPGALTPLTLGQVAGALPGLALPGPPADADLMRMAALAALRLTGSAQAATTPAEAA